MQGDISNFFDGKRTIQSAIFDNEIGPLSIYDLLKMQRSEWTIIRNMITRRSRGGEGLRARCTECGNPVYIATKDLKGTKYPYFSHFKQEHIDCKWSSGKNRTPDSLKAEQYHGQQTSFEHELMVGAIAKACAYDNRYIAHTVDDYLKPKKSKFGRYPDIYVKWKEIGEFVIEYQHSNSYQTEITDRNIHYYKEGIPIIWVLPENIFHEEINQSFYDITNQHRGTAFVFDHEASVESHKRRTLILKCYSVDSKKVIDCKLACIDDLNLRALPVPYFFDNTVKPIIDENIKRRKELFVTLSAWDRNPIFQAHITEFIAMWVKRINYSLVFSDIRFLSAAYSLLLYRYYKKIKCNKNWNMLSNEDNPRALINTYLSGKDAKKYAFLMEITISKTFQYGILKDTNLKTINTAKEEYTQYDENSPLYAILTYYFPEYFDELLRVKLLYHDELPIWAK